MRILWVKADKLLPVQNGGNIRSYHVLRYLSARHELTFCSYYAGTPDAGYEGELRRQLPGAVPICTGKRELSGPSRGLDYLLHLTAEPPYAVSRFADARVRKKIQNWFRDQNFDVAVCDFLDAAVNFPGRLNLPSVLFQHNVESEIWRRHAATADNPGKKMIYELEFRKMLRYERAEVRKFHHVIAVSENDRALMMEWIDGDRITVVGAMDWEPNVDGLEFFCSGVWPSIKAEFPQARFRVVGRNPDRRVQKWGAVDPSIEVTGRVPSVVEHLRESSVVIVPLRVGGGTRLIFFEATATAKAVVSTTVGA